MKIKKFYDFVKKYQDVKQSEYKGNNSQVTSIKLNTAKLEHIINE